MGTARVSKDNILDLSGRCVEVIVGPDPNPTLFSVHEELICKASPFFKKALGGEWTEAKSRSVRFKDHDASGFHIYLNWLYCHTLPVRGKDQGGPGDTEYMELAKAYVLGDFLQHTSFKDAVLDAMGEKSRVSIKGRYNLPSGPAIRTIYGNSLESCKGRKLLVDLYVTRGVHVNQLGETDELPYEFLFDLSTALLARRTFPGSVELESDQYHESDDSWKQILSSAARSSRDLRRSNNADVWGTRFDA
ncbi:hypothetical protein B0I35DRAFT_434664 [Stachybotrys elegans]|uniref:BTB domain-containing protein n=1 Tax=Stachybotrys elegans TaxID=80388 RepID=A0A8K0WQD6_9HYPO|nr:hypothetical protein B0I35DRAFT_434664 [Stachybotrys elegans]